MKDFFYPFKKDENGYEKRVSELECSDLVELKSVSENWFVEYKSDIIDVKKIAKSISSFANQHGGWLIFGIVENEADNTVREFHGIDDSTANTIIERLRNASKDVLNPEVFYETKKIKGPCENIGLEEDKCILIVKIPEGPETPYIHSDGKIYMRIGDSSCPKPLTDRSTLERLVDKSDKYKNKIRDKIEKEYIISKLEENNCYLNLFISSDPYEISNQYIPLSFEKYLEIMKDLPIPFDTNYSTSSGFISRQAKQNNPYQRLFTWELDFYGHSFVTVPINILGNITNIETIELSDFPGYEYLNEFYEILYQWNFDFGRILDLNMFFELLETIIERHKKIAKISNISGPFYVKVFLENVWRTVPFIDLQAYITHLRKYGIPINQEEDIEIYSGYELKDFIKLSSNDDLNSNIKDIVKLFFIISNAFGIPEEFFGSKEIIYALPKLGKKFKEYQKYRNQRN